MSKEFVTGFVPKHDYALDPLRGDLRRRSRSVVARAQVILTPERTASVGLAFPVASCICPDSRTPLIIVDLGVVEKELK